MLKFVIASAAKQSMAQRKEWMLRLAAPGMTASLSHPSHLWGGRAHRERRERCDGWGIASASEGFSAFACAAPQPGASRHPPTSGRDEKARASLASHAGEAARGRDRAGVSRAGLFKNERMWPNQKDSIPTLPKQCGRLPPRSMSRLRACGCSWRCEPLRSAGSSR
jgi:hypothetical protein